MTLAENVLTQAKRFFSLPLEKKMDVCTDLMPNEFCGYHPMEQYNWSSLKRKGWYFFLKTLLYTNTSPLDLHEAYNWNYDPAKDPDFPDPKLPSINMWPKDMPEFEENLCAYQTRMVSLARQLTRMFALALEIPENSFDDFVRRPEAGVRILHYPEQTATADDQNGIGAHTDVEYFTIITQDSEGLEVLSKSGQWIKVQPVKNAFVVNIADCFMRQTNDFFVSTIHRVINRSGRERYSVPFFWGFNRDTLLTPVPTCVEDAGSSRYELMTAGEYYLWRTRRQKQVSATSMAN